LFCSVCFTSEGQPKSIIEPLDIQGNNHQPFSELGHSEDSQEQHRGSTWHNWLTLEKEPTWMSASRY
jgi:hypothetical protein